MPSRVKVISRENGVSVLTFTNPPVNALSSTLQLELSTTLKSLVNNPSTRAVVLHGIGSPGFFSSGADVSEFASFAANASGFSREANWCYEGSEDSRPPVVAAIDGVCFGGALELVLCCAGRVATPASSFSLPELKLGIIPGLGGTQRLPRIIGFEKAVTMMLKSSVMPAQDALNSGLVDSISQDDLLGTAVKLASRIADGSVPRLKNIDRTDRIGSVQQCEKVTAMAKKQLIPKLSRGGRLPQYGALLDASLYGVRHGGRKGLEEEGRIFLRLLKTPESLGSVHMFFATRQTSKVVIGDDPNPKAKGTPAKKVGIIGGGLMGAGIAASMMFANISVVIKELNQEFAIGAKKRVERNLGEKGKSKMSLLQITTEYDALADVDIVIEAALENPKLKQEIFSALESTCRPDCILASNTSTINLDLIGMGAPNAHREGRIIGVHFFSPAHKMPLLEIVRTEKTSPRVIKDVIALGKKIRKTPVLVGNCAGFAVNRLYFPQSMVAGFLIANLGLDPYRVDRACEQFGLPMGPFRLLDLVGLDIGVAVGGVFSNAFVERTVETNPVISKMFAAGRKGQKSGAGFYRYDGRSRVGIPDETGIAPFLEEGRNNVGRIADRAKTAALASRITDEDIVNMILLACANEGCRILHEGVAQSASDLDVCSVMGMAFPAYRGGLMYWAQNAFGGAIGVLNELEHYYKISNGFPLFKPSFSLLRLAAQDKALGPVPKPPLSIGSPDDIVVVSAFRTAVGRAGRGGFKDTLPDNILIPVLKTIMKHTGIDFKDVDDIITGTVLQRGDTSVVQLRVAGLLSGFPSTVPVRVVNRLCSSGLQAIADGAAAIQAGYQNIVIAGGIESMSTASMQNTELRPNPLVTVVREATGCYLTMGQTSENVAEKFGISRERQDKMAVCSHARAAAAKLSGRQRSEIVPIKTKVKIVDKETKKVTGVKDVVVDSDEGVRIGVGMARLAKLPAIFRKGGSTTPGNSSQLSDGAALVMLMKRSEAVARGLEPLASLRSFAVAGVDPAVMGIGPAVAIPKALKMAGITANDVDLFEINEAFGSQADYCIEKLGLNRDIVNVMGGAIAIGHPLGMTGGRLSVSIIHELRRRGGRFGVVSMCIGSGMGAAAVYEVNKTNLFSRM